MVDLIKLGENAKKASFSLGKLSTNEKNEALLAVADALVAHSDEIITANKADMKNGKANNMSQGILDRLMLDEKRIADMADGLRQVAGLEDPIGEVLSMSKRPNGMIIGKRRVPIGVIGIIYEARPNVTSDAFALCFKTSNATILKGGSDAINSNRAIVKVIREVLKELDITEDAVSFIDSTDREDTKEFMKLNKYVDLLIPRGSASLIKATVENSTIPVIETGTGNCHIYVDEYADIDKAVKIIINAKTQRIGVCNACESLVIHKKIMNKAFPVILNALLDKDVEVRGDKQAVKAAYYAGVKIKEATEEDFYTEYLDYIISVKIVESIDEAIMHINEHNTKHSEAIISENYTNVQKFLDEIDAACVYANASTRFTDGNEFGFGAEIGISTQKIHARGPMGLKELTSQKYIIYGDGQIR
ncbi:MAG: glutamate-5-semialdehyde dehydrogenase [Lachnospiraceae bacterium]|nr:glutamate-5-semialdehyde dehydrogenase [Lachnospiraceae bacterium]